MKNTKKNFLWNIIGSSLNAFVSLFLLIIVNRINGSSDGGIFTYCFSLACLLFFVVNYFGRTFQVTDINNQYSDKEYVVNRIISFLIMIIILTIIVILNDFGFKKNNILIALTIYRGLDGFSEVFYGILHKNNLLFKVGISMTSKALISVLAFIIIDYFIHNIVVSCWIIVVVNLIITIIYDYVQTLKVTDNRKVKFDNVINIYKTTFFIFGLSFLSVYITNVTKYNMSSVSNEMQNIYGIILMPSTFISLCGTYLINPYLEPLSSSLKISDFSDFYKIVKKLIKYIILLGTAIIIGTAFLGPFLLKLLYGIFFDKYRLNLIIIMIGSVFYVIGMIYSNALTTIRKTVIQFIIYIITAIFGYFLSSVLISKYSIEGATLSYITIMGLQLIMYVLYFKKVRRRICDERKN